MKPVFSAVTVLLGLGLVGCAHLTGSDSEEATESAEPTTQQAPQPPAEESINYADFDQETLYSLLAAEVAAQRGRYDVTLVNYVEAAKSSRDIGVIKRAMRIAQSLNGDNAQLQLANLWLEVEPNNLEAHRIAAIQYVRQKDFDLALYHMEQILAQGEDADFDDLAALSARLPAEDQQQLLKLYRDLAERHPDNREIRYGIALLLKAGGDPQAALEQIEPLLDESEQAPFQPAIILRGDLLYQMGQQQEALDYLRYQSRRFPDNRKLGTLYGRMLIEEEQMQAAEDQFQSLMERFPDVPGLQLSYALVALENGNADAAEENLTQLVEEGHHLDEAHYYLGRLDDEAGQPKEAIEHYSQVTEGAHFLPSLSRATYLRGTTGDLEGALADLRTLRQQNPDLAENLWLIEVNTLLDLDQKADALGAATEALQEYPENARIRYTRAMLFDEMDRIAEAEADLRQIVEAQPDNAVALNALGYILTENTDRLQEARELLERALDLDPQNPAILDSVGWVHYKLGNMAQALDYLRQAYDAFPDPEVAAHYGEALYVNGEEDQARVVWRRALDEHPDDTIIPATLERLGVEQDL
ncbi:tetratricopeptide repeat protein [Marinobacter nanhaiticus D15-8W]|uniref:Tetratricopeptide repeat protein n=1 Tax=Marinobacter nanhaiticus D15-8W TaxID=626887 RepID=N6WYY3_9GAMM|nr:tetratricopeptide repeat protein [Marinobacter nanhaiticus]ENO16746.2 tetratricopeptide repeat protein [Marinobacter nanhaiticus D15-8W]BES72554.1 tetratricopeptide repeat protein [Marinobacter nanhaiticus D15-8W]